MLSGRTFESINPATGQPLSTHHESQPEDIDTAARASLQAFSAAQDLPHAWQATLLDAIADATMDLGDSLLQTVESESALPRPRTTGERARTVGQLKMFAAVVREGSWVDAAIDTADPARTPAPKPDLRRMLVPRGPVAVFGASNFPLAFGAIGGDTASALAAGCPVIVKGHPSHPATSELLAKAVHAALAKTKLPTGLFTLLQGKSHDLSASLVNHPAITAVGFTGSHTAGRALFNLAAARPVPIPVYAEMGSTNPLVVLPGPLKDRPDQLAQGLANSILLGAGQFCTKPGLILTLADDGSFTQSLARHIQSAAASAFTMLNQPLRNNFCDRATKFAAAGGVNTILSGTPSAHASITPSLFETTPATFLSTPELREEAFGPAALVVRCSTVDELLEVLTAAGGSLTATLHTTSSDDPALVKQLLRALSSIAGRVVLNGFPTGVEVNHAIVHSGPYPATTDPSSTSVGSASIRRFTRLLAFQDTPDPLLPPELQNHNPLNISRTLNGTLSRDRIA